MPDFSAAASFRPLPSPTEVRSTDDVTLAVYDLGGVGDDLLFVHATGFCAGVWAPVADHLDGNRLAALDVRGHGRSEVPAVGMAWEGTAQDVLATVDALGLERPFGVGHSMGGASLVLAEQARPGTFRGLWLYEPIIFPSLDAFGPDPSDNPLSAGARRRRPTFESRAAALANYSSKPPFSALDPASLAAYVEYGFEQLDDGSVTLRCRPEVEAQTYEMGPRHTASAHLGEVGCPVTVLRGHTDVPGPADLAPVIAEMVPDGTLEEHPELGHFGPLEDPTRIAASIRDAVTAAP
ncbi:alpha/beta hydrolase [soil metagenome]